MNPGSRPSPCYTVQVLTVSSLREEATLQTIYVVSQREPTIESVQELSFWTPLYGPPMRVVEIRIVDVRP